MANEVLPYDVRKFVFDFIDSVETLEVLLVLSANRDKYWSVAGVTSELRGNANSVARRLSSLQRIGLVEERLSLAGEYRYAPKRAEWDARVAELAALYATKRHRVLELIFNPVKNARAIADAFLLKPREDGGEESDG